MHELVRITGITNPDGEWYLWWSGFASLAFVGGTFGIVWKFLNCHESNCKRIGLYHVPGTPFKTCAKHHPHIDESRKISADHIKRAHQRANSITGFHK